MIRRVFETMFQAALEYSWLDDKKVRPLDLSSMLRKWLQVAWCVHGFAPCPPEDVHEGCLFTAVDRDSVNFHWTHLNTVLKKRETDESSFLIVVHQWAVLRPDAAQVFVQLLGKQEANLFRGIGMPGPEVERNLLYYAKAFDMVGVEVSEDEMVNAADAAAV
jgi:hypothetical protein